MIDLDSLSAIFRPESIAVVGASDKVGSVGHAVYANLKAADFAGALFPVNQQHDRVQGDSAYRSIAELHSTPELVVVCTPAPTVPEIARQCGERGVRGLIVISAGFREAGEAGRRLEQELRQVLQQFPQLRMIGPNCLGVLAPHSKMNASFSATMPKTGGLAVISQSGALCTAMLDWSQDRELGFSAFISVGNMLDVGMGDLIDYLAADEQTNALILYIESLTDPRHFMAAARACTRTKPIIALKSGRFVESSQAASSHTGAIAGVDTVYDAALRRAGVERVFSFDDLFDCARLLVENRVAPGSRLAIVTNAGGPGVMASDAWLAVRGQLAKFAPETLLALNSFLPPQWSHGNPVDVLGDASSERFTAALELVARDPNVDAIIVILTPQSMTNPTAIAEAIAKQRLGRIKPLLAVWMGGPSVRAGRQVLERAGIPVYVTPEQAVSALSHLVSVGRLREESAPLSLPPRISASTDSANSTHSQADRSALQREAFSGPNAGVIASKISSSWQLRLQSMSGLLGEIASKELFADYSIPIVPTRLARNAEEAVRQAELLGFPAVLKIVSPDISHKTDVGGVELSLANSDAVQTAYQRIVESVQQKQPAAEIDGVSVQPMIAPVRGVELLLGATRDAVFGPVIVVGSGGVTAEIQRDVAMQLPPLSPRRVLRMLKALRIAPILEGYRGRPGVDLNALSDVIIKFSRMVEDRPELQAVEINPLLVTADQILALDARVIVRKSQGFGARYSHLAVRPYPTEWIRLVSLNSGEQIQVRPIRLDDEIDWLEWLHHHSDAWLQFRNFPQRGCSLDYDSEMLLIAETRSRKWLGVAFVERSRDNQRFNVTLEIDSTAESNSLTLREELRIAFAALIEEIKTSWNDSFPCAESIHAPARSE